MDTEPIVTDAPAQSRYEIHLGDELVGFATYDRRPGAVAFLHTEVDPSFEGRGLGGMLVRSALEAARDQGLDVLPFCPYVRGWIERHRDFLSLVPESERARFRLPAS